MINGKRIHGLDALRAVAMLLGVLLHSAIAYKVKPHRNWLHDGDFNSVVFDYLYFLIHSFRMALFFLIAGFFCRLLYYKIGEKEFIRHRWKRVGIPFIFSMIFILPLSVIPYNVYVFIYSEGLPFATALQKSVYKIFGYNGLAHLWFLYDLLFFYLVIILLLRSRRFSFMYKLFQSCSNWWMKLNYKKLVVLIVSIIPVWLCLIPESGLSILTDTSIIPKRINNLFFYGYMVLLGWLFNKRSDIFVDFSKNFNLFLWPGVLLSAGLFYIQWKAEDLNSLNVILLLKLASALQVNLLVFGFIGLFLVTFKNENKFWKYISDASYWVYLIHLGIVITMQVLFLDSKVPGILRFPIVLSVAVAISFITYQWMVRYTFIGTMLHGPRF